MGGTNHGVSVRDIRAELKGAGWSRTAYAGQEEVWEPADRDGSRVRFKSTGRAFGAGQAHSVRKAIEIHRATLLRAPTPDPAPDPEPPDTELVGPAVPEVLATFVTREGFDPPLPIGTPVVVRELDPVTVDLPTLGRQGVVVVRWAAAVPVRSWAEVAEEAGLPGPEGWAVLAAHAKAAELPASEPPKERQDEVHFEVCLALGMKVGTSRDQVVVRVRAYREELQAIRADAVDAGAPSNQPVRKAVGWVIREAERARKETADWSRRVKGAEQTLEAVESALTECGVSGGDDGLPGRIRRLSRRSGGDELARARNQAAESKETADRLLVAYARRGTELGEARAEVDRLRARELVGQAPPAPGTIPNWSDERIGRIAEQLGMVDALRWMLGRAPNREELIAAALGALEERLGSRS